MSSNLEFDLNEAHNYDLWERAHRELASKIISEWTYEGLIDPKATADETSATTSYQLEVGSKSYDFRAKTGFFGQLLIEPESLQVTDALQLTIDLAPLFEMSDFTLAYLVRELQATLISDLHLLKKNQGLSTEQLLKLAPAELESRIQGHPWLAMSKGRLGFSYKDLLEYSPEKAEPIKLHWLALSKERAQYTGEEFTSYDKLIEGELGEQKLSFEKDLSKKGLESKDYVLLPVHPWQWEKSILPNFMNDVLAKKIVYLGAGRDSYLPGQSVRTFANFDHPELCHIKLPISIFNTSVYRGLPQSRIQNAPKLSQWLKKIQAEDEFLTKSEMIIVAEIAGISYTNEYYDQIEKPPYQFKEHLGAIWRQSPVTELKPGERLLSLAALIHKNDLGQGLVTELVRESGQTPQEWTRALADAVVLPLAHFMYRYGVVFNPHGENAMVVVKDGLPQRLAIKDLVDDVNISEAKLPELESFPGGLRGVTLEVEDEVIPHFILTSLFVCVFRYLSPILEEQCELKEEEFWSEMSKSLVSYQEAHPELKDRFEKFNLQAPEMIKVCINKVRVLTQGYGDDSERPVPAMNGLMPNPIGLKE